MHLSQRGQFRVKNGGQFNRNIQSVVCANLTGDGFGCTLTALASPTVNPYTYSWTPVNLVGSTVTNNLSASTVYTVTATDYANCQVQTTLSVIVPTNCCMSPGLTNYTAASVSGSPVFTGPLVIQNSFTLQPSSNLFLVGEILIAPGVSITVGSGAQLIIYGAHLYSCGDMWKGIVVLDGGKVVAQANGTDNLIEDAETAISVSNYTSSTTPIIDVIATTFNKNRTSIAISNYSVNASNPFKFNSTIFTCRDFTFAGASWPQTGTVSTGLRAFTTPTPDLSSPYVLQNAPFGLLKSPYSSSCSKLAIKIENSGVTTGTSYPTGFQSIELVPSTQGDFVIYDAHERFISTRNSNVRIVNSIFQNTRTFSISSTQTVGAAVTHTTDMVHNFKLDLSSASPTVGNKFYNCHRGIFCDNVFDFRLENAWFSSTQSNTALTSGTFQSTGQQGVFINTKQADNYSIKNNQFVNIQTGVTVNFYSGPVNAAMWIAYGSWSVWPQTSYVGSVAIVSNTFSPELSNSFTNSTDRYIRNGVVITSPHLHYMYTSCNCNTVTVNDNLMYRVYNGVRMDGLNSYVMSCRNSGIGKAIAGNTITLDQDFQPANAQRGIEFTWSQSYPVQTTQNQKVQTIERNLVSAFSVSGPTVAMSNTNIALVYLEENGSIPGNGVTYPTPHLLCNEISDGNKGFMFVGWNKPTSWRGNKMDPMPYSMGLYIAGTLGQQGDNTNPIDNEWIGTSWPTTYSTTYVDGGSNAAGSKLWVRSGSMPYYPTNNGAPLPNIDYNLSGNLNISASGAYTCGASSYTLANSALPNSHDYPTEELLYIANTFAYRFLDVNDSLRDTDTELGGFYSALEGSSIDLFTQIELKINEGNYSEAESILGEVYEDSFNQVESNYFNFYTVYLKFMEGSTPIDSDDVTALMNLAAMCPGENGSAVYQARSLYQVITGEVYNHENGCAEVGARYAQQKTKSDKSLDWRVEIFPNPAQDQLTILTSSVNEVLHITIVDLTGRVLKCQELRTGENGSTLKLGLINGAYFITIVNSKNETVTKQLLITK